MKKSLLLLSGLSIGLSSFGQEINLEFSKSIKNAGDQMLTTASKGIVGYGLDRKGGANCALKLENQSTRGYVKMTNMNTLDFTSPFSISIWFRTYDNGADQYLFTKGANGSSADFAIRIGPEGMTGGVTLPDYLTSTATAPTKWYHYAMVHDGDSISVFLDNVLKSRRDLNVTTTNSDTAMIGYGFGGSIDQFLLYSYPLSRNEVNSLYIADSKCPLTTDLQSSETLNQEILASREGEEILVSNRLAQDLSYQIIDVQGRLIHSGTLKGSTQSRIPVSSKLVLLNVTDGTRRFLKKL